MNSHNNDLLEITIDKEKLLAFFSLSLLLVSCGFYIIYLHGFQGILPGILFVLIFGYSTYSFGARLLKPTKIGVFSKIGYEDYLLKINIPWEDFEIEFKPSTRVTIIALKILEFEKYSDKLSLSAKRKCVKNLKKFNGHIVFSPFISNDIGQLIEFIKNKV